MATKTTPVTTPAMIAVFEEFALETELGVDDEPAVNEVVLVDVESARLVDEAPTSLRLVVGDLELAFELVLGDLDDAVGA